MLWISAAIIGAKPARSILSMSIARRKHPGGLSTQGARPKLFQSPSTLPAARVDLAAPVQSFMPHLDREQLTRCVQNLKERERAVVVMTFYDEQTARMSPVFWAFPKP